MPSTPPAKLLASFVALVLAVLVGPAALGGSAPAMGGTGSCAWADGSVHVGVVVDFGTVAGGPSQDPAVQCVAVASGASGVDAVEAGGHTMRFNGAGLMCAIDGYPATGCGVRTASGYRYWTYWSGGSSWTYATIGPAARRPKDGSVEGWRFVEGAGGPSDPAPRASSASPCPTPVSPPPTSPTPSFPGPAPSTPIGPAAATTLPVSGSGKSAAGSTRPSGSGGAPSSSAAPGDTEAPEGSAPAADAAAAGATPTSTGQLSLAASPNGAPSGGVPMGAIAALLVVVGLGVGAAVRFRGGPR